MGNDPLPVPAVRHRPIDSLFANPTASGVSDDSADIAILPRPQKSIRGKRSALIGRTAKATPCDLCYRTTVAIEPSIRAVVSSHVTHRPDPPPVPMHGDKPSLTFGSLLRHGRSLSRLSGDARPYCNGYPHADSSAEAI